MAATKAPQPENEFLKKPLHAFDIPTTLLYSLTPKTDAPTPVEVPSVEEVAIRTAHDPPKATSCRTCGFNGTTVEEQRIHFRSDFHRFNVKRSVRGEAPISEDDFEKMAEELNESISGSDTDEESNDGRTKLSPVKESGQEDESDDGRRTRKVGSPLVWFTSPLLPKDASLGVYRNVFSNSELLDPVKSLIAKQLTAENPKEAPHYFLCMVGGGHFAAAIVALRPKNAKAGDRQIDVLAHKTFHRYTTRRKQGGAQSANDQAKGAANSAGAQIRRYNEIALAQDIRNLLEEWKDKIQSADKLFIRATGNTNRKILFGYDGAVLESKDDRIRGFPFSTKRPTQAEIIRSFVELTRVKVSYISEEALKTIKPVSKPKEPVKKEVVVEDPAVIHSREIIALIKRSKAPALLTYLATNSISPNAAFTPPNHHTPYPLHLAASLNLPAVVSSLLTKTDADPTLKNDDGRTAYELAGDRAARDAFRVARGELGESKWDWEAANVPAALTKRQAEVRAERERKEEEKKEKERRKAELERLQAEEEEKGKSSHGMRASGVGRSMNSGNVQVGLTKMEEQTKGLSEEAKRKLERERRARAAEERIRRMQQGDL
ncbi:hypothetical protein BJ508DRAFT_370747 [Ascobolus immersus RN42]|uniref:VLRF1 domain-containing protein n=1 Tax=Ascobolus immersus RN42 TaxID=1160509 RepID=A0A3N4I2F5_ASCIM|nr:hypothetical protein BJ508DRAFT_370747 [Ascobolus immersus RN42]